LQQPLDHLHTVLLLLEHFRRDAILAQDGLDHGLISQVWNRVQKIGLAFFRLQVVRHLLDQWANDLLLLIQGNIQFMRKVGEQQFLLIVVIHDRRRETSLITAIGTARHIGRASQKPLFGLRILGHIEELLHVGCDHLAAARTGDLGLRHVLIFRFTIYFDFELLIAQSLNSNSLAMKTIRSETIGR
jgi:hypothetical protein